MPRKAILSLPLEGRWRPRSIDAPSPITAKPHLLWMALFSSWFTFNCELFSLLASNAPFYVTPQSPRWKWFSKPFSSWLQDRNCLGWWQRHRQTGGVSLYWSFSIFSAVCNVTDHWHPSGSHLKSRNTRYCFTVVSVLLGRDAPEGVGMRLLLDYGLWHPAKFSSN